MFRAFLAFVSALPQALFPACLTCCAPIEECEAFAPCSIVASGCLPCSPCGTAPPIRDESRGFRESSGSCCLQRCLSCRCRVPLAIRQTQTAGSEPWVLQWSGLLSLPAYVMSARLGHDHEHHTFHCLPNEVANHNHKQSLLSVWTI